jgi:hypothetical protein
MSQLYSSIEKAWFLRALVGVVDSVPQLGQCAINISFQALAPSADKNLIYRKKAKSIYSLFLLSGCLIA